MRNLFFYCLVALAVMAGAVAADGVATPKRLAFSEKLGVEVFALPDSKGDWCQPTMTLNIMVKDNSALLEPSGLSGFLPKLNPVFDKECPQAIAANVSVIKTLDNSVFGSLLNISKADGWAVKTSAPETIPVKNDKLIGQETSIQENNNKDISEYFNSSWIRKIENYFHDITTKKTIVNHEINKQITTNCIDNCVNGQGTLTYPDGTKQTGFFKDELFIMSFDCKKAMTLVEKLICSNEKLSSLDNILAQKYKNLTAILFDNNNDDGLLQEDQNSWLEKDRNKCQDSICIENTYNSRIVILTKMEEQASHIFNQAKSCNGDCVNGQGTLTYQNRTKYEGSFRNGKREGQGTLTGLHGDKYVGEWKNNEKNGQGTLTFPGISKYEGMFKDMKKEGKGSYTELLNGEIISTYIGDFHNNEYEGQGTQTNFIDGKFSSKYIGEFKSGKYNGHGTDNSVYGLTYTGEFKNGKHEGQGTLTYDNGIKQVGEFKDGKFIGQLSSNEQENKQSVVSSNPVALAETNPHQVTNKLTEQSIKNAIFFPIIPEKNNNGFSKPNNDCKAQFNNGIATSCDEQHEISLIAYGDLNADKQDDAVISVASTPEGANHATSTIAFYLNNNGIPQYLGGVYPVPDNQPAFVESLLIKEGKVFSDLLAMKDTDALCCPSLKLKEIYQLQGNRLIINSGQNTNQKQKPPPAIAQPNITQQINNQNTQQFNRSLPNLEKLMPGNIDITHLILAAIIGALVGAYFSDKGKRIRKYIFRFLLALIAITAFIFLEPVQAFIVFLISAFTTAYYLRDKIFGKSKKEQRPTIYGSAEWADFEHLVKSGKFSDNGLFLGDFYGEGNHIEMKYSGDRHLLTIAPTRSGKGVSAIIPNLLSYQGSMLVIDPKGENAKITAARRAEGLGQKVHIVDPWGITGKEISSFNPLDWLSPDDEDVSENAMILADSIVTQQEGNSDPFWNEEAKALLMGIILHVALDDDEQANRTLARVRDIIVSSNDEFKKTLEKMFESKNSIVSSTAARTASKDVKLRASVLAALQAHTHFLDSPKIRKNLNNSSFNFGELKTSKMTIYLVLPSDRLETFGRWLRLLIQQAITINARNIESKPEKPIIFMLDEMPALGRLTMVEQAYGLMAGFGMQIWGIVQDLSQLERIYGKGWETFIGNSGVLQYFGSRDQKSAEYFSKLCGVTTIEKVSFGSSIANGISKAFGTSSSITTNGGSTEGSSTTETESTTNTHSINTDLIQRHLAYPDELMVLHGSRQLVFIENLNPIDCRKISWYSDSRFSNYGKNLNNPNNQKSLPMS
ncbi:type IV secretory system conjugative DNA transfer family protein [Methylomonas sp. AM2-LC]|uniref:type IV secretory system conjugative DNA transfer family protein n=1 Tax=Methylomonas sp. AM2-LC TaxID=3153301 RepID=UPI0032640577